MKVLRFVLIFFLMKADFAISIEGGRECGPTEFPSSVPIYTSIKNENGIEIWNSMCSGTVAIHERFVLTASHCFLPPESLVGYFSYLPKQILENAIKRDTKLSVEYYVNGTPAKLALQTTASKQAILIFEKAVGPPPVQLALNHVFEKGSICHIVGFSEKTKLEKKAPLPDGKKLHELSLEQAEEVRKIRAEVFQHVSKRCGDTAYAGVSVEEGSGLQLFEGYSKGFASVQGGDSGGSCYVKSANGEWVLAGTIEEGDVKVSLNSSGIRKVDGSQATNPRNNGLSMFSGTTVSKLEFLVAEAFKIKDQGPSAAHGISRSNQFIDGKHITLIPPLLRHSDQ